MGCGSSRSSRILPTIRFSSSTDTTDNHDADNNYAPVHHSCSHCGRPCVESSASPQAFTSGEEGRSSSVRSMPSFSSSLPSSPYTKNPNSISSPIQESITSPRLWLSNSTYSNNSLDDGSETSRSYSLLSTPSFRSPAKTPGKALCLIRPYFPTQLALSRTAAGTRTSTRLAARASPT
ncbi:unnamed protein product [Ectocarpus sp. 4 AP-2014]